MGAGSSIPIVHEFNTATESIAKISRGDTRGAGQVWKDYAEESVVGSAVYSAVLALDGQAGEADRISLGMCRATDHALRTSLDIALALANQEQSNNTLELPVLVANVLATNSGDMLSSFAITAVAECIRSLLSNHQQQIAPSALSQQLLPAHPGIQSNLREHRAGESVHHLETETCTICMDAVGPNDGSTACGHYFHDQCLSQWLSEHSDCPVCKRQLVED
jgi:hypothetical protein